MNKKKYLKPTAEITGITFSSFLANSINDTNGNGDIEFTGGGVVPGRSPYYYGNWANSQDWEDSEEDD